MLANKIEKYSTLFFFSGSLFVMFLLLQGQILTWLNQFKILYLWISATLSIILTLIFFLFIKKDLKTLPSLKIPALALISIVCFILVLFPHDNFGGGDAGTYINRAVYLANTTNLKIPSYLENTPLNVEGWKGTPEAYIVWLSLQKIFFGEQLLSRGNLLLIFFGLSALYLTAKFITSKDNIGLITLLLFTSCMPFLWFSRETLTENLSFFLLWTSIIFFLTFFKTRSPLYLIGLILGTTLFSFTRLEGILVQLTTFFVVSSILIFTKTFSFRKNFMIVLIYLLTIVLSSLLYKSFVGNTYFQEVTDQVSGQLENSILNISSVSSELKLKERVPIFLIQMLNKYNLTIVFFSIFSLIPLIILDKKVIKKNRIYLIGIFLIVFPEFYKLIDPSVTIEEPWMYRRYIYAIIPFGYLCFAMFIKKISSKSFSITIFSLLLLTNILSSSSIIMLKNNWFITGGLEKLMKNINSDDFVVVKNENILNDYGPIKLLTYRYGVRSLYPYWIDLEKLNSREKKVNGISYKKLYFLSDKESDNFEGYKLLENGKIEVQYSQLVANCRLGLLRDQLGLKITDFYYLPFQDVVNYCKKTENQIINVKKRIFLYELI